jgi:hypothetical protein
VQFDATFGKGNGDFGSSNIGVIKIHARNGERRKFSFFNIIVWTCGKNRCVVEDITVLVLQKIE